MCFHPRAAAHCQVSARSIKRRFFFEIQYYPNQRFCDLNYYDSGNLSNNLRVKQYWELLRKDLSHLRMRIRRL